MRCSAATSILHVLLLQLLHVLHCGLVCLLLAAILPVREGFSLMSSMWNVFEQVRLGRVVNNHTLLALSLTCFRSAGNKFLLCRPSWWRNWRARVRCLRCSATFWLFNLRACFLPGWFILRNCWRTRCLQCSATALPKTRTRQVPRRALQERAFDCACVVRASS